MELSARPVEDRDIPTICAFARDAEELFFFFPKAVFPLTPRQLREAIGQRCDSTVVEADGEVAAFANFYRWGREGCAIGNVVVAPAARGLGIGRFLIEFMVELAFSKHGADEVTVSCFNRNVAGLLLYPKLGFKPGAIEARKDCLGVPVALIHLHRRNPAEEADRQKLPPGCGTAMDAGPGTVPPSSSHPSPG